MGQTITCSLKAFGANLFVNLPPPLPSLNFLGSIRMNVLAGGVDFVRLEILDFALDADHPLFGAVRATSHRP